ncbi:MAG: DNA polymerase III subunit gamma/tau [Clostridiales bacterium]|nr:DNA polymerase III subunit gamma/tau [Clostridiales bacterium]
MKPLSLKYRPKNFNDFVGNEVNAEIIRKSIVKNKLSISLLFSGRRGTGKTSMARVVAKSLNCPNTKNGEPCNECSTCKAIDRQAFLDVMEIDAVSNSSVNDMRQLAEETRHAPQIGDTKVYIIDECHALSSKAWKALLKPIEEAKDNIKFIFCTTKPHKVIGTIKSRLNLYRFQPISQQDVVKRIKYIKKEEDLPVTDDALDVIAKKSKNAMRDAVNLLEQVYVAWGDDELVEELLSKLSIEEMKTLIKHIVKGRVKDAVNLISQSKTPLDEAIRYLLDFLTHSSEHKKFLKQIDKKLIIKLLDLLLDFHTDMNRMDEPMLVFKSEITKFKLQYVKNPSLNFKSAIQKLKKILNPDTVYQQDNYYVFVKNKKKLYIVKDKDDVMKGSYLVYPSDVVKLLQDRNIKKHIRRKD